MSDETAEYPFVCACFNFSSVRRHIYQPPRRAAQMYPQTMCERTYELWECTSHVGVSGGGDGGAGCTRLISVS